MTFAVRVAEFAEKKAVTAYLALTMLLGVLSIAVKCHGSVGEIWGVIRNHGRPTALPENDHGEDEQGDGPSGFLS